MSTFKRGVLENNPAWAQLLGLCPLLAVSNSVVNALGLAIASGFVLLGSNLTISLLRHRIPDVARLPCFVLIIATFTTITVMILEAFAFALYLRIAVFVQIIVTNCMNPRARRILCQPSAYRRRDTRRIGYSAGLRHCLTDLGRCTRNLRLWHTAARNGFVIWRRR